MLEFVSKLHYNSSGSIFDVKACSGGPNPREKKEREREMERSGWEGGYRGEGMGQERRGRKDREGK